MPRSSISRPANGSTGQKPCAATRPATPNEATQQLAKNQRAPATLSPLATPPYYAMPLVPSMLNTQGGPIRNERAQVVGTDGKPIARLYSAGELGSVYSYRYQAGGNLGECFAFGRIAVRNAAAEPPLP